MGSPVLDKDFIMILITSLPEAWDNYTSAYLGSRDHTRLLPFFLMKIEDVKVDPEAQLIWHYRQRAKINKGRERMTVMKRNAVRRRDTLQKIVGQKVEAWKGRDHKGEEG